MMLHLGPCCTSWLVAEAVSSMCSAVGARFRSPAEHSEHRQSMELGIVEDCARPPEVRLSRSCSCIAPCVLATEYANLEKFVQKNEKCRKMKNLCEKQKICRFSNQNLFNFSEEVHEVIAFGTAVMQTHQWLVQLFAQPESLPSCKWSSSRIACSEKF